MPRTEKDASSHGYTKISDCGDNPKFLGKRYMKNGDTAVILIYGVNGYIVGIQCGLLTSKLAQGHPTSFLAGHPYIEDGDKQYLTAYFINPASICTTGRNATEVRQDGTGYDLYIQNGTDPVRNSVLIPHSEADVGRTMWTKGRCFPSMGMHYWYNTRQDMSCDDFFPVFLLYNGGKLNAFGWAINADLSSPHLEHPPTSTFTAFMDPVPSCLYNAGPLATLHIYLTGKPALDLC
ncbi:hypothetical protein KUTeg_005011 [Tegillarca granosa]|uniref:Uncharacterized protein n=1 Tax=Tegillarca granosa TaxID=220873 RepID=A0ABQ9FII7_TEGGR|nr:hypothetical protein KUTeg_005011 [Tegillarca granosa]